MNKNDLEFGMEREIINAKTYLYSAKNSQGQNLYDLPCWYYLFRNYTIFISFDNLILIL